MGASPLCDAIGACARAESRQRILFCVDHGQTTGKLRTFGVWPPLPALRELGIQKLALKSKSRAQRGTKAIQPRKARTPAPASNIAAGAKQISFAGHLPDRAPSALFASRLTKLSRLMILKKICAGYWIDHDAGQPEATRVRRLQRLAVAEGSGFV